MNQPIVQKDRPWCGRRTFKNGGTKAIAAGQPVILAMNGTNDGVAVHLPSESTAAKATTLFKGIALQAAAVGDYFDVAVGYVRNVTVVRQTRAATTDSFASAAAVAVGDRMYPDTVGDGMLRSDAGAAGITPVIGVALDTLASKASSASTTSDATVKKTDSIRVWITAM